MKQLKLAALALLSTLAFAACSDDDDNNLIIDPVDIPVSSVYVINQGNAYGGVDGTIDRLGINYSYTAAPDTTYTSDVFNTVNGQSLGSTPENAIVYGSHLYVPMNAENLVWVLNAKTLKIEKQITTTAPMWVAATDGKVFVSNYAEDGTVSVIDTTSLSITSTVAVGSYPEQMCTANGRVYVSVSDGMNYSNNYVNGKRVAVINASTCAKEKDITVGLNPGPIAADTQGNIFVVSRGDYAATPATVQKIDASTDAVTDICEGSLIATYGNVLYVVNSVTDWSDWMNPTATLTLSSYTTTTGAKRGDSFLDSANLPAYPTAIAIEPLTGDFYITSDQSPSGYSIQGYLYVYKNDGQLRHRYDVGIHPYAVAFSY